MVDLCVCLKNVFYAIPGTPTFGMFDMENDDEPVDGISRIILFPNIFRHTHIYIYIYMCVCIYLSIYLFIYLSIDRSIDRSNYLSTYLSIHRSIYLSIYLSTITNVNLGGITNRVPLGQLDAWGCDWPNFGPVAVKNALRVGWEWVHPMESMVRRYVYGILWL